MRKTHAFGGLLAKVRRQQGFPTAHAFYKGREGRKSLRLSYRCYLDLEQGRSLPKPERLQAILLALGLAAHAAQARELVEAYFASLGLGPLTRFLRSADVPAAGREGLHLGELATREVARKKTVQLSAEQWKVQAESYAVYVCDTFLVTSPGGLNFSELAQMTGLAPGAVERAVRALASAGLAEISGRRVRSKLDDKLVESPPLLPAMVGIEVALQKHTERLSGQGKLLRHNRDYFRMTEENFGYFNRQLDLLFDSISVYGSGEKTGDSSVYLFQGRTWRLFPR